MMGNFIYHQFDFENVGIGWQPQQARSVLPNALKTEVVMTGFVSDWKCFFELRTKRNCYPQMRELAIPLEQMFIDKGYILNKDDKE